MTILLEYLGQDMHPSFFKLRLEDSMWVEFSWMLEAASISYMLAH